MQPLIIEIEGTFYDSYLSGAQLLLFSPEGAVRSYSWHKIAEAICEQNRDPIVREIVCQSGTAASPLLRDARVRAAALERITEATNEPLYISRDQLDRAFLKGQEMPVEFPFASFDIYGRNAYVAGSQGISSIGCYRSLRNVFSSKGSTRLFDLPCTWMTTGWDVVVASAGDAGLWEIGTPSQYDASPPAKISDKYSIAHGWLGASLYTSSPHPQEGALIEYGYEDRLEPVRVRSEREILGSVSTSWGGSNRICGITDSGIRICEVSFGGDSGSGNAHSGLILSEPIDIDAILDGHFVGAANSEFGTIVETENQLTLIDSDYKVRAQNAAPINWRVYPRSKTYGSFLSVALEGKLLQMIFPDNLLPADGGSGARGLVVRRPLKRSSAA